MAQRRGLMAMTAFYIGLTVSSCALPTQTSPSITATEEVVSHAAVSEAAEHANDRLSAAGADRDCVLTRWNIRLWCKWISRYY